MKKKLFIASLISVVAALCVGGLLAGQRTAVTEIAGGPGGGAFLDPEPAPGERVVEVQVRAGDFVDSVQFVYSLNGGRTVVGQQHGGPGGGLNVFRLDDDEYIIGIAGHSGVYVDSIRFLTNKRSSPVFGGPGGANEYRIVAPQNTEVMGLTGRSGVYVDAIGLTFAPARRGSNPGFGDGAQSGQTTIAGGPGGGPFADGDVNPEADIVEVRIRAGDFIDSIQMIYALPNGRPLEAANHGGAGGRALSFRLRPGEYIVGLSGRCGDYVDSVRIVTNMRTSESFGGPGGAREYHIEVPEGNQATGFRGRSGVYLDAIGLNYARAPERRSRDRRRDR